MSLAALALPLFVVASVLELVVERRPGAIRTYRWRDVFSSFGVGLVDQLAALPVVALLLALYAETYARFALLTVDESSLTAWLSCFVAFDLGYYCFHRAAHALRLMWPFHAVHHDIPDLNLTVALRNGAFQRLVSFWFFLPLAAVGFPPRMGLTCLAVNVVFQFFLHTRHTRGLPGPGPLGLVLNMPSYHRVHHYQEASGRACNLGGVFIVWDRLFGTFREEEPNRAFGIPKPSGSRNPVLLQLLPWLPDRERPVAPPPLSPWVTAYVLVQGLLALGLGVALLSARIAKVPIGAVATAVVALVSISAFAMLGAIIDGWTHAARAEAARGLVLMMVSFGIVAWGPESWRSAASGIGVAAALGTAAWLRLMSTGAACPRRLADPVGEPP